MYQIADLFLSDKATVEVTRGEYHSSDVQVCVRDFNGDFQILTYLAKGEVSDLIDTWAFLPMSKLVSIVLDGFRLYDYPGQIVDELVSELTTIKNEA